MTKYPKAAMTSCIESGTSETSINPESVFTQPSILTQFPSLSENNVTPITGHQLNGNNFIQWSQSVMIFICGKGKEDYLTGAVVAPEETSPAY